MKNPQKAIAATSANEKQITVVNEGITGKQLIAQKIKANKANKDELQSFSFNQKQFLKHSIDLIKSLNLKVEDLTPKNLLPYLTESEAKRKDEQGQKFSFWLFQSIVMRYAKANKSK